MRRQDARLAHATILGRVARRAMLMPTPYIALIRGINVGRAKRVAMADLRALVETLGYRDVRSLLNSGNLVFAAPSRAAAKDVAARIELAMAKKLGVEANVTVLSGAELATVVRENTLLKISTDSSRLLVAF